MEYERELIQTRIESIKDPLQKVLLQDVLKDVFQMIIDYSENCFKELEKKIDAELDGTEYSCDIYTGICEKDKIDETSPFLYPIEVAEGEVVTHALTHIFLACGQEEVETCIDRIYPARIETDENSYDIKIKLSHTEVYPRKIEWLYQQFQANGKPYRSIYIPFLYKYLEVIDFLGTVPKGETIRKLVLDLGDKNEDSNSKTVYTKVSLLWNIQEISIDTSANVVPGDKAVLYEHKCELSQDGSEYLAVLDPDETFYVIRYPEYLVVRTEKKSYDNILFLRIAPPDMEKDTTKCLYPLQSNGRKMRHSDKQAERSQKLLYTFGEMHRLLSSYYAYEGLHLEAVEVKEKEDGTWQDCNSFLTSHTFLRDKRILLFSFTREDKLDIMLNEKLVFLMSELQLLTEEYRCVGKIVDRKDTVL